MVGVAEPDGLTDGQTSTKLSGETTLVRSNTCSSEYQEDTVMGNGVEAAKSNLAKAMIGVNDAVVANTDIGSQAGGDTGQVAECSAEANAGGDTDTGSSNKKSSAVEGEQFHWESDELKRFWLGCFAPGSNVYVYDGLHPKALCSKICNDVLRTNININSSNANPNDRLLCFEVLNNLEQKFIEAGIVEPPTQKPGGNLNQRVYKRVLHTDFNRFATVLADQNKSLESWARDRVEESIRRISMSQSRKR